MKTQLVEPTLATTVIEDKLLATVRKLHPQRVIRY